MSIASIALPRIFRIGGGASKQLPGVLGVLGLSRPLIVTDGWLVSSGRVAELTDGLTAAGIAARVFADTVPDPTVASIDAGVEDECLGNELYLRVMREFLRRMERKRGIGH